MNRHAPAFCCRLCAGVFLIAWCALPAAAQDRGLSVYQEQLRVMLDQQSPEARQMAMDAGGWLNFAYYHYDDATVHNTRSLAEYDLRLWASANISDVHRFYVRGVTSYMDWDNEPPGLTHAGYVHPSVERAWYEFDLNGKQRASKQAVDADLLLKVGRDFMEIGTGLVLAQPLDMVKATATLGPWDLMAFLAHSVPDTPNIDQSPKVLQQHRWFWGSQLTYTGLDHHRPFAYFLGNDDQADPHRGQDSQNYNYTSRYVGAGSTGTLILPDLHYQAELVGEWGETYSWRAAHGRDDIEAMALDAMLEYYFQAPTHPRVMAEYLYGSGDRDRKFSSSDTIGGNARGTDDHAFNAFGFRDTGISLAPRVSNLHIYEVGASFFPLERVEFFRKMEVGTRLFVYQKATGGAISDTTATSGGSYVGWEGDVFIDWRITSDLTWTIRYGNFVPGTTYNHQFDDCRNFLYTGIAYSF